MTARSAIALAFAAPFGVAFLIWFGGAMADGIRHRAAQSVACTALPDMSTEARRACAGG